MSMLSCAAMRVAPWLTASRSTVKRYRCAVPSAPGDRRREPHSGLVDHQVRVVDARGDGGPEHGLHRLRGERLQREERDELRAVPLRRRGARQRARRRNAVADVRDGAPRRSERQPREQRGRRRGRLVGVPIQDIGERVPRVLPRKRRLVERRHEEPLRAGVQLRGGRLVVRRAVVVAERGRRSGHRVAGHRARLPVGHRERGDLEHARGRGDPDAAIDRVHVLHEVRGVALRGVDHRGAEGVRIQEVVDGADVAGDTDRRDVGAVLLEADHVGLPRVERGEREVVELAPRVEAGHREGQVRRIDRRGQRVRPADDVEVQVQRAAAGRVDRVVEAQQVLPLRHVRHHEGAVRLAAASSIDEAAVFGEPRADGRGGEVRRVARRASVREEEGAGAAAGDVVGAGSSSARAVACASAHGSTARAAAHAAARGASASTTACHSAAGAATRHASVPVRSWHFPAVSQQPVQLLGLHFAGPHAGVSVRRAPKVRPVRKNLRVDMRAKEPPRRWGSSAAR